LGAVTVAMDFLPDVTVECEVCHGQRFNREVLEVRLCGLSVAELLQLSVAQAQERLAELAELTRPLASLGDVGLGYLRLGQATATLSAGELQRLRLAPILSAEAGPGTVIILDEPTVGLFHTDVDVLISALRLLVCAGATLVVVEHNLELVAAADHVIDLGPEGGPQGGRILVAGPPAAIAACPASATGRALRQRGR
jgi:excinuclease ABC subunit A